MATRKRTIKKASTRTRNNAASHKLYQAAQKADDAWSAELKRVFGARAGDARYDQRGSSTPKLKKLKAAFDRATALMRKGWGYENPAKRKRNTTIIKAKKIGKVIIRKRPSVANPYAYQIQFQRPGEKVQYAGAYYTSSRADALKQAETDLKRRKIWKPKTKLITGAVPLNSTAAKHPNPTVKGRLSDAQIEQLRAVYSQIERVDPSGPTYTKLKRYINLLDSNTLTRLADARIKWVSRIAALQLKQREGNSKNPASPKVRKLREDFTGLKSRKTAVMNAPKGTPANLAKLGKLISIKAARGTIRPGRRNPSSTVWLCADARGKLHLCTAGDRLIDGPAQSFGEIREIEYEAIKPHLGHARPTIFFHKMAEEGGKRPELRADGAGGLKIQGGSYYITPEGIRN